MADSAATLPTQPTQRDHFLRRLTLATAFGDGLDGYDLGIISVVIATIGTDLHIPPITLGLIGASSLIGIFIGAPFFGYLTDLIGRRKLFLIDILVFLAAGTLQAFALDGTILFILRLILGLAIGAEYAIGSPLLAEFSPSKDRGRRLALLQMCWYIGFLIAVIVGYILIAFHIHWRWILGTSAIPAIITLWMRRDLPESPRWLNSHGKEKEALAVINKYLGNKDYYDEENFADDIKISGKFFKLFNKDNLPMTIFTGVFWACLVAPYFAIFTFAPTVMSALGITDPRAVTITENGIAAAGAILGFFIVERVGRRKMLIIPFWIQAVALLVIGVWSGAPTWLIVVAFGAFAACNAMTGNLTGVYPSEVFPTDIRGSGVGAAAAVSRIGAAAGTWLLPVGLDTIGVRGTMAIAAGLCVIGALVSHALAPETTGKSLTTTSLRS